MITLIHVPFTFKNIQHATLYQGFKKLQSRLKNQSCGPQSQDFRRFKTAQQPPHMHNLPGTRTVMNCNSNSKPCITLIPYNTHQ